MSGKNFQIYGAHIPRKLGRFKVESVPWMKNKVLLVQLIYVSAWSTEKLFI